MHQELQEHRAPEAQVAVRREILQALRARSQVFRVSPGGEWNRSGGAGPHVYRKHLYPDCHAHCALAKSRDCLAEGPSLPCRRAQPALHKGPACPAQGPSLPCTRAQPALHRGPACPEQGPSLPCTRAKHKSLPCRWARPTLQKTPACPAQGPSLPCRRARLSGPIDLQGCIAMDSTFLLTFFTWHLGSSGPVDPTTQAPGCQA
jgi:hypothetical protein